MEKKIFRNERSREWSMQQEKVASMKRHCEYNGEWWEEVQNARKRSFALCFGESRDSVKSKYVKSKNEYLYNLSSLQNEKKLIRVYEINHGKEEDAFIFTIDKREQGDWYLPSSVRSALTS